MAVIKKPLQVRFGRLVAANRKIAGITQAQLAEQSELAVDTIAKVETGATGASFDTIEKLANVLRVDPAQLFTPELQGQPFKRKAMTDLVAELGKLSDSELRWVTDLIRTALKPKQ
jgi:transcriptional regulator with XRE-family HTH domain